MANGEVLRGSPGLPIYGKNGTILFKTNMSMSVHIVVSWSGGNDVDICGFYTHFPSESVGYSHKRAIDDGNGFTATWDGDDRTGGPEYVDLAYTGSNTLAGKSFEIRANWFNVGGGKESGSGGNATITATDSKGNKRSCTIMPATEEKRAAHQNDPGVVIRFNSDGTIRSITAT